MHTIVSEHFVDADGFGVCFEMGKKCYRIRTQTTNLKIPIAHGYLYLCRQAKFFFILLDLSENLLIHKSAKLKNQIPSLWSK